MQSILEFVYLIGSIVISYYIWNRQSDRNEARHSLLKAAYTILYKRFYDFLKLNPQTHKGTIYEQRALDAIAASVINEIASSNVFKKALTAVDQHISPVHIEDKKYKWLGSNPDCLALIECVKKNQGSWLKYFLKTLTSKDNEELHKLFELVSHEYVQCPEPSRKAINEYSNIETWIEEGVPEVRSNGIFPSFIVVAVAFLLLLPTIFSLPRGYFEFLRIVVCGFSGYAAYVLFNKKSSLLPWLFVLIAILFNPFDEISLSRSVWREIDLIVALIILLWAA